MDSYTIRFGPRSSEDANVKISELSQRTETPIPTIKFYIREGLMPAGRITARNQAEYDDLHVERLDLIRSLRDVAKLSIPIIGKTLAAVDRVAAGGAGAPHLPIALRALSPELSVPKGAEKAYARAEQMLDAVIAELGWRVERESSGRPDLVRALVDIDRFWSLGLSKEMLVAYGRIAEQVARLEIPEEWNPRLAPADAVRYAVLGTVLFEPLLRAMCRLAAVDRNWRLMANRAARKDASAAKTERPAHNPKRRGRIRSSRRR
jgi:DNA-binding transcriptional MerR regulator